MTRRRALEALAAAALSACQRTEEREPMRPRGPLRLVLKYQPFGGDPAALRSLLARFEAAHPDVVVVAEALPSASDVVHQFYLTALEGRARDFDVFVVDVVWTAELARAGWIADLSATFAPDAIRAAFLPAAAEAAIFDGRTYAVPLYLDAGLLYRRLDLCPTAPRTYEDLADIAISAVRRGRAQHGYVWQARQSEGLVCNAYEAMWGHGAETQSEGGRLCLDSPEAERGVAWLVSTIARGASPPMVTSMAEEESRRVFQEGRAVFMRNWPYAFTEAQRKGSSVRGNVAISPLPTVGGEPGAGALGGYQLALNVHSPSYKREAALALIGHLTGEDANTVLAIAYGRNPPRRAVYRAPRLIEGAPFVASLLPILERARPRPKTPYYPAISDALAAELSAAITRVRPAGEALARAAAIAAHLTQAPP